MMNGFFLGFALALLLWFVAFFLLKSFVRRRTSPDYVLSLLQEEVDQLEADIDVKTEQSLQLMEEKIRVLREICADAEQRIAVYSRELEKREKEKDALAALGMPPLLEGLEVRATKEGGNGKKSPAVQEHQNRQSTNIAEMAYRAQSGLPSQVSQPSVLTDQRQPEELPIRQPPPADQPVLSNISFSRKQVKIKPPPIKDRIAELHHAGFAPELIAERLGINLGEVKLYFSLVEKP